MSAVNKPGFTTTFHTTQINTSAMAQSQPWCWMLATAGLLLLMMASMWLAKTCSYRASRRRFLDALCRRVTGHGLPHWVHDDPRGQPRAGQRVLDLAAVTVFVTASRPQDLPPSYEAVTCSCQLGPKDYQLPTYEEYMATMALHGCLVPDCDVTDSSASKNSQQSSFE